MKQIFYIVGCTYPIVWLLTCVLHCNNCVSLDFFGVFSFDSYKPMTDGSKSCACSSQCLSLCLSFPLSLFGSDLTYLLNRLASVFCSHVCESVFTCACVHLNCHIITLQETVRYNHDKWTCWTNSRWNCLSLHLNEHVSHVSMSHKVKVAFVCLQISYRLSLLWCRDFG